MKRYSFHQKQLKLGICRYMLGLLLLFIAPSISYGNFSSKLRKLIHPIHFNLSVGYGITQYNMQTANLPLFSKDGSHYIYNPAERYIVYLVNWFKDTYVRMKAYENPDELNALSVNNPALQHVAFNGIGSTIPINLSGHIDILKKFRLELGGSISIQLIKALNPDKQNPDIPKYIDSKGIHYDLKIFLMPGFKVLENSAYTLLLNTQLGMLFMYGDIIKDRDTINRAFIPMPIGIGITLEKHISEYFSVFSRLLYENSNFTDKFAANSIVNLQQQTISLQFGVTINCPEIPRCPLPNCDVEVKHKHSNKSYRGVSIFKGKNSLGYRLYTK